MTKKRKRRFKILIKYLLVVIMVCLVTTGCAKKAGVAGDGYFDPGPLRADQLQLPEVGEEIAVITTDKGVMKMRLFDKVAPKAVEDFKYRVREGFFNGLKFENIVPNVKIGLRKEINPDMPSGVNYKNEVVGWENDKDHRNLVGSCVIPTETTSRKLMFGSFYIVCGETISEENLQTLEELGEAYMSADMLEAYRTVGGLTRGDEGGEYTVFGQVIYGLDLMQEIHHSPSEACLAINPVVIEKIEIVPFEGR